MSYPARLDVGLSRLLGNTRHKTKKCLVLEAAYRYKAALSDLSGADIAHHRQSCNGSCGVRNWLKNECRLQAPGPTLIWDSFNYFMADIYVDLLDRGFSKQDVDELPIPELIEYMQTWVASKRS